MTLESRFRTLAQQDENLQSMFCENGICRIFDRQLAPGYLKLGKTCARVRRISTVRMHSHETRSRSSLNRMAQPRIQIDVIDFDAERARAAAAALITWLTTVADFSSNAQFSSPATTPTRRPNFILNQRADMEYTTQPPAYVETLDVRLMDMEDVEESAVTPGLSLSTLTDEQLSALTDEQLAALVD